MTAAVGLKLKILQNLGIVVEMLLGVIDKAKCSGPFAINGANMLVLLYPIKLQFETTN